MANVFANAKGGATAFLGAALKGNTGRIVTIRRRGTIIGAGITASVAFHEYQLANEDGSVTVAPVYDWTFTTADLSVTLRDGDEISEVLNNVTCRYEVLPIGSSSSVTPADSSGVLVTVHTKKVAG